jgi:sensor histidine kinase YesM
MVVAYIMVYFLIPKYLLAKKYLLFTLYSFYTFVFSSYLIMLAIFASLIFLLGFSISNMPPMSKNYVFILILVYLVVGIISFISLLSHSFKTASRNKELQNKILNTQLQLKEQELHYLKMQIHPHFLFNTLNTIYGFAIKQSKQTPEIILKLSNLLDYILYQVDKPRVSLKEEVLHIKEYIELEKIRFKDNLNISLENSKMDEEIQIAPMLMIPFVENAFKHGSFKNGFLNIEISIQLNGKSLEFSIRNTATDDENSHKNGGLGLKNIRKRLELHYLNNYKLKNDMADGWYTVELKIDNLNQAKND